MTENTVIITKIGLSKIAGASVEQPLILEKFALGDGQQGLALDPFSENATKVAFSQDITELINEKYRDFINDKYSSDNNIVIECVLRGNAPIEEGFYIRELGILDVAGDLIAIVSTPEQYRPALSEGVLSENIFSVVLKIENTENIAIQVQENIFATCDALSREVTKREEGDVELLGSINKMLERLEKLEADKQALIESSIGVEKHFNTDNTYKDQNIITLGVKVYALMDASNILTIADYPVLFKNLKAVDRGDGTFIMPSFYDGTLRHLAKGNARALGTFEDDAMQEHTHNNTHGHTANKHKHSMSWTYKYAPSGGKAGSTQGGVYDMRCDIEYTDEQTVQINNTTITTDEGTGKKAEETRMKNTAGQWYILAKVLI